MRPYVPSGRTDPGALTRVMLVAGLGAVVIGVVAHLAGARTRPVLFLALLSGAASGVVTRLALAHWRVRAPRVAAISGLAAALVVPAVDPVASFVSEREALASAIARAALQERDRAEAIDRGVNRALLLGIDPARAQLDPAFAGALLRGERVRFEGRELAPGDDPGVARALAGWVAQRRIRVAWPHARESAPLQGLTTWALCLFELTLTCGAAAWITYRGAASPFCERCGAWLPAYGERVALGGEHLLADVRRALARDDAAALAAFARGAAPDAEPMLMLKARACATCDDPPWFVELEHHTRATREVVVIDEGLLPRSVVAACFAGARRG